MQQNHVNNQKFDICALYNDKLRLTVISLINNPEKSLELFQKLNTPPKQVQWWEEFKKNAYHNILGLLASVIHTCDFTDLYSEDKYNKHHLKKTFFSCRF